MPIFRIIRNFAFPIFLWVSLHVSMYLIWFFDITCLSALVLASRISSRICFCDMVLYSLLGLSIYFDSIFSTVQYVHFIQSTIDIQQMATIYSGLVRKEEALTLKHSLYLLFFWQYLELVRCEPVWWPWPREAVVSYGVIFSGRVHSSVLFRILPLVVKGGCVGHC